MVCDWRFTDKTDTFHELLIRNKKGLTGDSRTKRTLFFKLLIRNKKIHMSPAIVQYILFSTRVSKYMSEMSGEIESQKGVYIEF